MSDILLPIAFSIPLKIRVLRRYSRYFHLPQQLLTASVPLYANHLTVRPVNCMVNCQMLEGFAKIILPTQDNRSKTGVLYIPADIVKDSSFPFDPDQEVVVRIDGKRLVVEERRA